MEDWPERHKAVDISIPRPSKCLAQQLQSLENVQHGEVGLDRLRWSSRKNRSCKDRDCHRLHAFATADKLQTRAIKWSPKNKQSYEFRGSRTAKACSQWLLRFWGRGEDEQLHQHGHFRG